MRYRWVGNYVQDFGAVMVGPGEYVELDEAPQELVDNGTLIEAPQSAMELQEAFRAEQQAPPVEKQQSTQQQPEGGKR
jgi:hypothetical protein